MARIRVDLDSLITARDDNSAEMQSFLDLETGEVVVWIDPNCVGDIDDAPTLEELENNQRYRPIPHLDSRTGYTIMEEFTSELPTSRMKGRLIDALSGRRPFRAFKDALLHDLGVRDLWFTFEHREKSYWAERWLREEGIEADVYDSVSERRAELKKSKP